MEDISLHILDVAENSLNAGATLVKIRLTEKTAEDIFSVRIEDNGRGIPKEHLREVLDPFYTTRTTRKTGMGLSLLAQSARETGGDISIESSENKGTVVEAWFRPSHVDMKPLGNISDTLIVLITGNPAADFDFAYFRDGRECAFDTRQIKEELEGVPMNSPRVMTALRKYLQDILADMGREGV
ncbi:MAG: ATP-binding protein [Candidatus Sulfobium sp.]|jgi:Histidine kinase-, DNA gyrase B-, and HSP90-like ATPase